MDTDSKADINQDESKDDDSKAEIKNDIKNDDDYEEAIKDPEPSNDIKEKVLIIITEIKSSSQSNNDLNNGIEKLLYLEKKQRQNEEEPNTIYIAKEIINICYELGNWDVLIEQIGILSKRRSQFRRVIMRIVQLCMTYIDKSPNMKVKLALIDSLRNITSGKIFVEVERARLTKILSDIKENEGNINDACDILGELQIETFGSMKKREKCEFLLEQMRLNLLKKDYIRARIVRNKITQRIIKDLKDLEIKYWKLSLLLFFFDKDGDNYSTNGTNNDNFLDLAKAYKQLQSLSDNNNDKLKYLSNAIYATVLSKYNNETNDILNKTLNDNSDKKLLENIPLYKQLLILLTTHEIINYPLNNKLTNELNNFVFKDIEYNKNDFDFNKILKDRLIQHNIRVAERYYKRISIKKLSTFLKINIVETERYVSELVIDGTIYARIDRLSGIINFRKQETVNDKLNAWKFNIDKLLELVNLTTHMIQKEIVVNAKK